MEIDTYSRLAMWLFTIYYIKNGLSNDMNGNSNLLKLYGCINCKEEYISEAMYCADCGKRLGNYYD